MDERWLIASAATAGTIIILVGCSCLARSLISSWIERRGYDALGEDREEIMTSAL